MTSDLKNSLADAIYQNMQLKDTSELLAIWSDNDRLEWSQEAFEIVHKILLERQVSVPPQGLKDAKGKRSRPSRPKIKSLLPIIIIFSPFALIFILFQLIPVLTQTLGERWVSVLMICSFSLSLIVPGVYFVWMCWFQAEQTKRRIIKSLSSNNRPHGFFYRLPTLFLPDRYVPSYLMLSARILAIELLLGGFYILYLLIPLFR